jgi:hypothetical protein
MKTKTMLPQILMATAALLLLGGLGVYWPALVDADATDASLAPEATIGDAITYQGYLTDENGVQLNGTFTMRFRIFNAQVGGTLLWDSGNSNVTVIDGLFEKRLGITTDIFNGEELWVSQIVNGETLTPRQEILPAPMAHTLRPGAIIKGTANAIPNNYTLEVQMNNDVLAFNRAALMKMSPASLQRKGALVLAACQPNASSTAWAASAMLMRTALAATASMPVVIRGLSISVATDWHSAASRPNPTPITSGPRVCSQPCNSSLRLPQTIAIITPPTSIALPSSAQPQITSLRNAQARTAENNA